MATDQQKAKKKELLQRIENGIKDVVSSDNFQNYLRFISKFHSYSLNNTMLLYLQNPDVTLVAGYSTWQKKFNRHVRKGEKHLTIIRPQTVTRNVLDENGDPVCDESGQPLVKKYLTFRAATVFDISQTDGEPVPELETRPLTADVNNYDDFMKALQAVSKYPIEFDDITSKADGYFSRMEKRIVVRKDMPQLQTISVMLHELAHSYLHDKPRTELPSREFREVEAETTAFIVAEHFGLDTSADAFTYLASWGAQDFKELHASFDKCIKQADSLITGIEKEFRELQKEKSQDKVAAATEKKHNAVYLEARAYAVEYGEIEQYRASMAENMECVRAIESAIAHHYSGSALDSKAAVQEVVAEFGQERVSFVLANTVRQKSWDGRIEQANKDWAMKMPVCSTEDAQYMVVEKPHVGLVNLFLNELRSDLPAKKQEVQQAGPPEHTLYRVKKNLSADENPHKPYALFEYKMSDSGHVAEATILCTGSFGQCKDQMQSLMGMSKQASLEDITKDAQERAASAQKKTLPQKHDMER